MDPAPAQSEASSVQSSFPRPSTHVIGQNPARRYPFSLRKTLLLLLPLLSVFGAFGTLVLFINNGTAAIINATVEQAAPFLPGSNNLLLLRYTGVGFIDKQLAVLVMFFLPLFDQSNGDLRLFGIFGFGQFGAAWTLMMMESMRMGNKGKLVSFIGTVGFLVQNVTFTVTVPLWLLLHLLTSPTAKPFPGPHATTVLLVSSPDLRILPFSVTLGYIVPSLLMALPSPSIVTPLQHQRYIALWQPFPIWCVAIHWSIRSLCNPIARKSRKEHPSTHLPTAPATTYLNSAKHLYRFVLTLCLATHIPAVVITLLPQWVYPGSALTVGGLAENNFFRVFVPSFPWHPYQVPSFAAGVHTFLQWDVYVGATSLVLWAVLLYSNSTTEQTNVDPNSSIPKYSELMLRQRSRGRILWRIALWTLISGPVGVLTILLWERDAIVMQKIKQGR